MEISYLIHQRYPDGSKRWVMQIDLKEQLRITSKQAHQLINAFDLKDEAPFKHSTGTVSTIYNQKK